MLIEQSQDATEASVGHMIIGASIRPWIAPLPDCSRDFNRAFQRGVASGNLTVAVDACAHDSYCRFYQAAPLAALSIEVAANLKRAESRNSAWAVAVCEGVLRVCHALTVGSDSPATAFDHKGVTDAAFTGRCLAHNNGQALAIYRVMQADALLQMGLLDEAIVAHRSAAERIELVNTSSLFPGAMFDLQRAWLLVVAPEQMDVAPDAALLAELQRLHKLFQRRTVECAETFQPIELWLRFELELRQERGDRVATIELLEQAIDAAEASGLHYLVNLFSQRGRDIWAARKCSRLAASCEQCAWNALAAWGASAALSGYEKVKPSTRAPRPALPKSSSATSLNPLASLATAIMNLSGAERALFLSVQDAAVTPVYGASVTQGTLTVEFPVSVAQHAIATRHTVTVDMARDDHRARFASDPHMAIAAPTAALAWPLMAADGDEVTGVVYVESRRRGYVFGEMGLLHLRPLVAQAAQLMAAAPKNLPPAFAPTAPRGSDRSANAAYDLLFDQAPVGVAHLSVDGRLTKVNPQLGRIFGVAPPELLQTALSSLLEGSLAKGLAADLEALLEGQLLCTERDVSSLKGQRLRLQTVLARYEGSSFLVFVVDVSAQVDTNARLAEARTKVETIQHAKNEFLACISHEIRTPLTGLLVSSPGCR